MAATQGQIDWESSPYPQGAWARIDSLGREVDRVLDAEGVRLTVGGEPTFVAHAATDPQWRNAALGEEKRCLGEALLQRLHQRLAPTALVLDGVGKSYPGEEMPRWALGLYWRRDGAPLWRRRQLLVEDPAAEPSGQVATTERAGAFLAQLAQRLGIDAACILPAFRERRDSRGCSAADPECRGYVLPLLRVAGAAGPLWASCRWSVPGGRLFAGPENMAVGLSLPLHLLPPPEEAGLAAEYVPEDGQEESPAVGPLLGADVIRVALCAETRTGLLRLFLPPTGHAENFCALLEQIEETAAELDQPVRLEGYGPPPHADLAALQMTPDPGVLEVNIPAADDWPQLVAVLSAVAEETAARGLVTTRYLPDGRLAGTGGGHHITLGARYPRKSPFFRRPDLLRSLLAYWQNHPGLSYGFAGLFVGPTSQAPRPDEVRPEILSELTIALNRLGPEPLEPQQLQRLVEQLLVDGSGNCHRTELCVDKLWPERNPVARLGLVELRGFEMQPHVQMDLVLALLVRALLAAFWQKPYEGPLSPWGTALRDRFALPCFIEEDLARVVEDLRRRGFPFEFDWLRPHLDFRFPLCGHLVFPGGELELRQALEPWPVLAEDLASAAAARTVDFSCERLQVRLSGDDEKSSIVLCNGYRLPLAATAQDGEAVAAVRFKARSQEQALHPDMPPQAPLRFEVFEGASGRFLGGALYHVSPPGGGDYEGLPADAAEAGYRCRERFVALPAGRSLPSVPEARIDPQFSLTLDLRRWF